jgi:hypothetical protein
MQQPGLTEGRLASKDPVEPPIEVYDVVEFDYDYEVDAVHRTWPRMTVALLAGVLMSVAFTGGVLVQKNHDKGLTSSATALPAGFPAGGTGAGRGTGGLGGSAGGGAGATSSGAAVPVLVGTVVSVSADGKSVKVKDLGGTTHTVTTTGTTTVSIRQQKQVTDIAAGDTVSITGQRAASGSVAATAFTIR